MLIGSFVIGFVLLHSPAHAQLSITPTDSMVLDSNALVLATGGNFSRVINGSPFQQENLITHKGYQYSAWYHNGSSDENIYVSRRQLTGTSWETIDTGYGLENGDATASSNGRRWDSHNIISMGISSDDRIHLAYDHHVDQLRYLTTNAGVATSSGGTWNQAVFNAERNSLNENGAAIPRITYPRFTNVGDDMVLTYRDFGSGNGDVRIADYNAQTGAWSGTRFVNEGRPGNGTYDDIKNNSSSRRNAYHNGFHADSNGRLHTTWTWREGTQDGNHDINYAYSDDKGVTWRNTDDQLVGTASSPIDLNSNVEIADLDRRQAILNQQGQIVEADGSVHALMFHRRQEPGFEWASGDGTFSHREDSAYHHYYRDPLTGEWSVSLVAPNEGVGSRPRMGVDSDGNLFALYTESNDLVIAGAERTAVGFSEWEVLFRDDQRNYEGTPLLDNNRLLADGILSVYLQDRALTSSETEPTGSALRVMEFRVNSSVAVPEPSSLAALLAISALALRRRRLT